MNIAVNPVLNALATIRPADWSGATAANRFQFQLSWAICRVLELHARQLPYALVLDLHDDVVELDHEATPTTLDFHQIKSKKTGNWTLGQLTKQEKRNTGLKPSILGKLCNHRNTFGNNVRKTSFVSNRPCVLALNAGKQPEEVAEFSLAEVEHATQHEISNAIQIECGVVLGDEEKKHVRFERTVLSPDDHEHQSRGRMAEFLEVHVDPNSPVNPIYKLVRSELQRRNNDERLPLNAGDIAKYKMFGRSQMSQLLELAKPRTSIREALDAIDSSLTFEGVSFVKRQKLRTSCNRIFADRLDASNTILMQASEAVKNRYTNWAVSQGMDATLFQGLEAVRNTIDSVLYSDFVNVYSETHFEALYLVVCHELNELSAPAAKPSEETP